MNEPDSRQAFGDRLRLRRNDLGLTQFRLAVIIDASPTTISHWERGHSYPQRPKLFKLAKGLRCDPRWLEGIEGARIPAFREDQETVSP